MTHTADNTDRQETTAMTDVRINLAGPGDQTIHLDGEDISNTVAAVRVQCVAGNLPHVTIDLALASNVTAEGKTEVFMSLATSNLLRRAGWTPPEGSRLGAGPIKLAPSSSVGGTTTSGETTQLYEPDTCPDGPACPFHRLRHAHPIDSRELCGTTTSSEEQAHG